MSCGSSEARNRIPPKIQRCAPNRAESPDGALGLPDSADVFDRLDRCSNLLTAKELAALLGVSPKTIYGYVARNLIPNYRIAASVRLRARDIADWLAPMRRDRNPDCVRFPHHAGSAGSSLLHCANLRRSLQWELSEGHSGALGLTEIGMCSTRNHAVKTPPPSRNSRRSNSGLLSVRSRILKPCDVGHQSISED